MSFWHYELEYKQCFKKISTQHFNAPASVASSFQQAYENAMRNVELNKDPNFRQSIKKQYENDLKYYFERYIHFGGTQSEKELQKKVVEEIEIEKDQIRLMIERYNS